MSKYKFLLALYICIGFLLTAFSQSFQVKFNSVESIEKQGGTVSPLTTFADGGMVCADTGKFTNFCVFPTAERLNPNQGCVEIVFKPMWSKSKTSTNCLFNVGLGVLWGNANTIHLQREGKSLKFIVIDSDKKIMVAQTFNLSGLDDGKFHRLTATWNTEEGIGIYIDGVKERFVPGKFKLSRLEKMYVGNNNIAPGGNAYYYAAESIIKELKISDSSKIQPENENLLKATLYPADWGREGKTALVNGIPTHMLFFYYGQKSKISKASLQLEVPAQINMPGLCQVKINNIFPTKPKVETSAIVRNGKEYMRYNVNIDQINLLTENIDGAYNHAIYLEPADDMSPGRCKIYWRLIVNDTPGNEREVDAEVIPSLKYAAAMPNFPILIFFAGSLQRERNGGGYLMYHPNDDKTVGDKLRNACVKLGVAVGRPGYDGTVSNVLLSEHAYWFEYGDLWGHSSKLGHPRLDKNGAKLGGYACPTYIANLGNTPYRELIKDLKADYAKRNVKNIMIDYELERPRFECYCPDCMQKFKLFAHIDTDVNPGDIAAKHAEKWGEFQCLQNLGIVKSLLATVREVDPGLTINFCNNFVFDREYQLKVGSDVRLFDPLVNRNFPMIYYSGKSFYDKMETTCRALSKPVLPFLCANDVISLSPIFLSPENMRMNLLSAYTAGASGAGFYPGLESFDAKYYDTLNRTLQEIARLEPYIGKSHRDDQLIALPKKLPYKVFRAKDRILLCVFNFSTEKVFFRANVGRWTDRNFIIYDLLQQKTIPAVQKNGDASFCYAVNANDVAFVVMDTNTAITGLAAASDKEYTAGLQSEARKYQSFTNNKNISFNDVDGDGIDELKIVTPSQSVWLNFKQGGRLWGWQVNGREIVERKDSQTGGMFTDLFYPQPGWSGKDFESAYELVDCKPDADGISVTLQYEFTDGQMKGLLLRKKYDIAMGMAKIKVTYELKNNAEKACNLMFRVHHMFSVKAIGSDVSLPGRTGQFQMPNSKQNVIYFTDHAQPSDAWQKEIKNGNFYQGWVSVSRNQQETKLRFTFDYAQTAFVYRWNGGADMALEYFYKPVELLSGQNWTTVTGIGMDPAGL